MELRIKVRLFITLSSPQVPRMNILMNELLYRYLIVTPNNINACGVVIQYWTTKVNLAVWMGKHHCLHF